MGALLVTATLDARPDPPAVSPRPAACKVFQFHDCYCPFPPLRGEILIAASHPLLIAPLARESGEPRRPVERAVLAGQAADPSPPAL
ncbi:MAG TPA: hypothetical protein VH639_07805 [Bryobacteraceae bacterium]